MSGTSLDGLDIACCRFSTTGGRWQFETIATDCISYTPDWKNKLDNAPRLSGLDLSILDVAYGRWIGEEVAGFINRHQLEPQLVSSHGHTVFHDPSKHLSLQIGSGAEIQAVTGLPVVCDFRSVDVSLGGQGAPLVPIGDKLLFGDYDACLNLGGIANISFDGPDNRRFAYDVSICNLLLNRLASEEGMEYDKNGSLAKSGVVNSSLLSELDNWKYYSLRPPKSLDKETSLGEILTIFDRLQLSTADKLATAIEHLAGRIGRELSEGVRHGKVLVTGGGAHNSFLIQNIKKRFECEVVIPDDQLIDYKEAIVFGFLGLLRAIGEINVLASVTGASRDSSCGAVYGNFRAN